MVIFEGKNLNILNKANNPIFRNFSFEIKSHEIWMASGPNGIGKSSLWEALIGIRKIESGQLFLEQNEITKLMPADRVRMGMKYISQNNALFDDLSVFDNLMIIAESLLPYSLRINAVNNAVKTFYLEAILKNKAINLSGGQRRRVELAKIMIGKSTLILLDEPFAAIDEEYTEKIANIFKSLAKQGASFLINDHNTNMVRNIANYCIHLGSSEKTLVTLEKIA